jgi:hypothetical protein
MKVNIWQDELIALIAKKVDVQRPPSRQAYVASSPGVSPMGYSQPVYSQPSGVYSEPGHTDAPVDYASSEGFHSCDSHGTY